MATKAVNAKSAQKKIRFPHELIDEIDSCVEREKPKKPHANFSAWVLDACRQRLEREKIEPKG
ncbi:MULTISPECIES: YlcI/YnfO family protein [unclassified Serratia (in: enterobacteria)]|uniref:YlcI/YnfO family protein n=1 Tax=unclassified Serratia (in: enterobacteria) TaxID=2647522 RepID=UPI0030765A1A